MTFQASSTVPPPSNRQYLLELLSVPDGVTGAPLVGTVWNLPSYGTYTLWLPTYRTTDGLTGYEFAFTITEAQPDPGDMDNDGDVDGDDFAILARCLAGPDDGPVLDCGPVDTERSDLNDDDRIDLADVSLFAANFTGLLASLPTYVGTEGCIECHEEIHTSWTATRHAAAFETLIIEGEQENPACLPCHTLGYGESSGFVDFATTPELANVQCESCHGPGSHHAADADNVGINVDLNATLCGRCHQSCHGMCGDYYHPSYEQWSTSKHSQALADIVFLPEYEDSCLECHATDYRLAPEGEKPTAAEAMYSLECVACHVPYGSVNDHQLRLPTRFLCAQCHTMRGAAPGTEPDQAQYEFMYGEGGIALDGTSLDGQYPAVFVGFIDQCAFCHVYRQPYEEPDQPADSGHDFVSDPRACHECHTVENATERVARVRNEIEPRLANLARYLNPADPLYRDPATLSPEEFEQYKIARFDYEFVKADRSVGAHNSRFARRLLDEAEAFFVGGP